VTVKGLLLCMMKRFQHFPNLCTGVLSVAVVAAVWLIASVTTAQEGSQRTVVPPRNTGPAATARSRTFYHRQKTIRLIRRTPEVMREDAARVSRGKLFSTWSNTYLE